MSTTERGATEQARKVAAPKPQHAAGAAAHRLPPAVLLWVAPIAFYLFWFVLLTYPSIRNFATHFFADGGDGFQNVWNLWWVNEAVTRLHTSPWFTRYLHYPHGTSLVPHTLNAFNGFAGIMLQWLFDLVKTHNLLVIFSFVAGGLTAFRLSWYLSGSFAGSLLAGWIFTFSNFHFAHAEGHLQLVSLEWIPLFVLLWWQVLEKPAVKTGIWAGLVLFLVLLCDYYYYLFCVLLGSLMFVWFQWQAWQEKKTWAFWENKQLVRSLAAFAAVAVATASPFVLELAALSRQGTMLGTHDAAIYSLDLLAPLIPGGHWRFYAWTEFFWSKLAANIHESSVHWGISVMILSFLGWRSRQALTLKGAGLWLLSLVFFTILALGPRIHVFGAAIPQLPGPYILLEALIPFLKLSGMPVRMSVMVYLCLGLLAGAGLHSLLASKKKIRSRCGRRAPVPYAV